jgi:hypothetical protein
MHKERDLLPWILGGLSTAAVALAIAAVSNHRSPTPVAQTVPLAAASSVPSGSTVPAIAMTQTPPASTTPTQPNTPLSETRTVQIWTCTTKGVKTFSNNPCGENSSLLEVGPINTMNPATPMRSARSYPAPPQYTAPYGDATGQSYTDDDADQGSYEGGSDSYAFAQGVAVLPRRRFEHHPHRPPYHHNPAPAPRKL